MDRRDAAETAYRALCEAGVRVTLVDGPLPQHGPQRPVVVPGPFRIGRPMRDAA